MPSFVLGSKRSNPCDVRLSSTNHLICYPLDSVKTQKMNEFQSFSADWGRVWTLDLSFRCYPSRSDTAGAMVWRTAE